VNLSYKNYFYIHRRLTEKISTELAEGKGGVKGGEREISTS
jgi:hypothetical protein